MVAVLVASVAAGRYISYSGSYNPIMIPASLFVVAGIAITTVLRPQSSKALWIPSLVLLGIGSGSGVSAPFIAAQTVLDITDISIGMAIMTFSQDFGEAVFITVAQTIFLGRLENRLRQTVPNIDPESIIQLGATNITANVPPQSLPAVILAYNTAITSTFYLAVALAGTVVVAALIMQSNTYKGRGRAK